MNKSLCVVTCHFNPCGYRRPELNLSRFCDGVRNRVDLLGVALAYDGAHESLELGLCGQWLVLEASRERSTMFQKEALLNVALNKVIHDYDAVAWVDADVLFLNPSWARDVCRELERCHLAQCFTEALMLDQQDELMYRVRSCGAKIAAADESWCDLSVSHPGFAWAARSETLKKTLLYDRAVTGCGDTLMLAGVTGGLSTRLAESGAVYQYDVLEWASKLPDDVKIGAAPGALCHMWHGDLVNRKTIDRLRWLREIHPRRDVVVNDHGVLEWSAEALRNKPRVVNGLRAYFESRREDQ